MAKSAYEIKMNYNAAVRQADSLSQVGKDLRKTAEHEFGECMAGISRSWTGNNASAYIRKCEMMKEKMLKTAGKLERTAEVIRKIAKNTYDAEMRALALARIRKY